MHDEIKKFSLEGELQDTNLVTIKERLVFSLESLMRDYGFVPALDLEPQFTLDYKPDAQAYEFTLSVYGVHVGKEQAWSVSGVMDGKPIQKLTHQSKSKPSQTTAG